MTAACLPHSTQLSDPSAAWVISATLPLSMRLAGVPIGANLDKSSDSTPETQAPRAPIGLLTAAAYPVARVEQS